MEILIAAVLILYTSGAIPAGAGSRRLHRAASGSYS
jgi:hypothetical protein